MYRNGPGFYGPNHGFGHPVAVWVFGGIFLALLAALVVVAIVYLVRLSRRPTHPAGPAAGAGVPGAPDPALTELRVRYARGEVDWDEYAQRAAALGFAVAPAPGPAGPPTQPQSPAPGA